MDLIGKGIDVLFVPEPFLMLVIGTIIGIFFGALPGFSSGNTSAMLLPLTLGMSTAGAILFIGGIYCGAQYGGSIPAILIGVPGTPGAIATVFDGFEMAKKGQADRAIGLALFSSTIGGIISSILAIFLVAPIANIALNFGPAEMTLMALLGLTIIITVAGDDIGKGLFSGAIGLLVSAASADPALGLPRVNFGYFEFYDEIPLTPVLMGLFAMATIVNLIGKERVAESGIRLGNNIWEGVVEGIKKPVVYIRSALIGLFVGIVPGAGIDIGSFMSYSQAKNFSRSPETFGKGNPEGVIASEAGNNGVTAGAMVPALALGIPGGTTSAVMLSALTLHGIRIGPQVVKLFPGQTFALMIGMLVSSLLIFPIGWYFNKATIKITELRTYYLIPAVFSLLFAGAFAYRQFIIDIYLCYVFGIIGILMVSNDFPVAPFVLGFILGPIAETNYLTSIMISQGSLKIFFKSSIAVIMWLIIFVTLFFPIILKKIKDKKIIKNKKI